MRAKRHQSHSSITVVDTLLLPHYRKERMVRVQTLRLNATCVLFLAATTMQLEITGAFQIHSNNKIMARPIRSSTHSLPIYESLVRPKQRIQREKEEPLGLRMSFDDYLEGESSGVKKRPVRIRPKRLKISEQKIEKQRQEAHNRYQVALQDPTLLSKVQFSDRIDLHPSTKRVLVERGLQEMTEIQSKTYVPALSGKNLVGRARTGTGKTLAFLLPSLERLLLEGNNFYVPGKCIGMLIVAPTRELAIQISDEASYLLKYHSSGLSVACIYGGTKMQRDINLLQKRLPTILVATPGRLQDHIEGTKIHSQKFADMLGSTKIVVLDEMDALLDMGFKRDILKILSYLPRLAKRQTLLFSATLPKSLRSILKKIVGEDYSEINCVDEDDARTHTNLRVEQNYMVLHSMEEYVVTLVKIINDAITRDDQYKIVVFLPTTRLVGFFAEYFVSGLQMKVFRLHSKMSQSSRQRTSQQFRKSTRSILFTSDVSARGVDYPDISLVVQYGSAENDDTYIHRLGRTGRAGKDGQGLQVYLPFEKKIFQSGRDHIKTQKKTTQLTVLPKEIKEKSAASFSRIRSGDLVLTPAAEGAYRSFLAYYVNRMDDFGISPRHVLKEGNIFAKSVGLSCLPEVSQTIAKNWGFSDTDDINIQK